MLRADWPIEEYLRYLDGLLKAQQIIAKTGQELDGQRPLRLARLLERLADPDLETSYARLIDYLDVPEPGLKPLFDRVFQVWNSLVGDLRVVLIVDQFEEIFSRFADTGRAAAAHLSRPNVSPLRTHFLHALREMYQGERPLQAASAGATSGREEEGAQPAGVPQDAADEVGNRLSATPLQPFPVRNVLSMRDEWCRSTARASPARRPRASRG